MPFLETTQIRNDIIALRRYVLYLAKNLENKIQSQYNNFITFEFFIVP